MTLEVMYEMLGLIPIEEFKKQTLARLEMMRDEFSEKDYADCIREERRQGATTQIIVQAIVDSMNGKEVCIRTPYQAQKYCIEQDLHRYLGNLILGNYISSDYISPKIHVITGTGALPKKYSTMNVYIDSPLLFAQRRLERERRGHE